VLHHVTLDVSDLERSARFYEALLAPLGWRRIFADPDAVGYGFFDDLLLVLAVGRRPQPGTGHFCVAATGTPAVKAAFEAAVGAGGRSEGRPSPRQGYEPGYYSAYLRDPDGYRVEVAVRHPARMPAHERAA
jgi:catechol 2,3-dioxygenase-like lactoylglutathione lyase family enzyme